MEREPVWRNPLKYFLHGILFTVLMLVLIFGWAFVFAILIVFGLFIGFIIGFVVLFFIMGGLNSFLTDFIWDIPIKTEWQSLLGHGFVLFIALLFAHIPTMIIGFVLPSLATTIVLLIIEAFISGFVAKNVAGYWEGEYEENAYEAIKE